MKRRVLLAILLPLTVASAPAFAQVEPGDAGMFFDPAGQTVRASQPHWEVFDIYVVVFDLPTPASSVNFRISVPQELAVTSYEYGPGFSGLELPPFGWVVADWCFPPSETLWPLRLEVMLLSPQEDLLVCLGPIACSVQIEMSPFQR